MSVMVGSGQGEVRAQGLSMNGSTFGNPAL